MNMAEDPFSMCLRKKDTVVDSFGGGTLQYPVLQSGALDHRSSLFVLKLFRLLQFSIHTICSILQGGGAGGVLHVHVLFCDVYRLPIEPNERIERKLLEPNRKETIRCCVYDRQSTNEKIPWSIRKVQDGCGEAPNYQCGTCSVAQPTTHQHNTVQACTWSICSLQ